MFVANIAEEFISNYEEDENYKKLKEYAEETDGLAQTNLANTLEMSGLIDAVMAEIENFRNGE